jgi:hypothetical protein
MVTNYQTDSGYLVEFPSGLDVGQKPLLTRPDKEEGFHGLDYVIRGKPGLINVRFQFRKQGNESQDVYNEDFAMVLRPSGMFTNFRGKTPELKGDVTIPQRYFPVEIVSITVENLSDRFD